MYLNGSKIWSATGWNDNNYAEQSLRSTVKNTPCTPRTTT